MSKKDHSLSWQAFDSLCQRLGRNPVVRHSELGNLVREAETSSERSLIFNLATPGIKRDGHEILQKGWQLENYRNNPVVQWAHDTSSLPIAKSLREWVSNDILRGEAEFLTREQYEFADQVYRLYRDGVLNATSVQWIPIEYDYIRDDDGFATGILFRKQELLEYSAVPVPADPGALKEAARGLPEMYRSALLVNDTPTVVEVDGEESPVFNLDTAAAAAPERKLHMDLKVARKAEKEEVIQEGNVIRHAGGGKAVEGAKWSPSEARRRLRDWATKNGKLNVEKYRQAFLWHDSENPERTESYKGLHHDVSKDGKLVSVFRAAQQTAQKIQQGAFDVPEEDIEAMREHISEDYKLFNQTPPWERSLGRQYEDVHKSLRSGGLDDEERESLRAVAVFLGDRVYGESRQLEAWEDRYADLPQPHQSELGYFESVAADYIRDTDDLAQAVENFRLSLEHTWDYLGKKSDAFYRILEAIDMLGEYKNSDHDVDTFADNAVNYIAGLHEVEVKRQVDVKESDTADDDAEVESAIERLAEMLGNKREEKEEEVDSTITDDVKKRMDSLFGRLLESSPVAGKQVEAKK